MASTGVDAADFGDLTEAKDSGINVAGVLKIMFLAFADDVVIIDSNKINFQRKLKMKPHYGPNGTSPKCSEHFF